MRTWPLIWRPPAGWKKPSNASVVIVHHCGIDATRPRGHTSLSGTVEVQLSVKRGGTGEVIVTVELAKDFPENAEIFSRLETVEVGVDPDGDKITSLVVLPAEPSTTIRQATCKLSNRQRLALGALEEVVATVGQNAPASFQLPPRTIVVPLDAWREELYRRAVLDRTRLRTRARNSSACANNYRRAA